jgi:dTDP-4-amino-4,6-dideoxygalactose transaminase
VVRVNPAFAAKTHRQIFDELRSKGIGVNLHYMPVHLQPYYRDLGFGTGQFPEAEAYGDQAISLPLFPTLAFDQQEQVVRAMKEVLGHE